jgi:sugar phosphate isomerase/epimerase
MRMAFSSNGFTSYPLLEAVTGIAALGYDGIELLADVPHLFAPAVDDSLLRRVQEALKENSLAVSNVNANTAIGYYGREFWEPLFEPSLANPEPAARKWRIEYTRQVIDLAHTLNAPMISITSGRPVPGCEPGRGLELLKDSLTTLLGYAAACDIRIGIEYEPGLLIENCEELADFLTEMDSPLLGANLDLGHSQVAGEDIETVTKRLGEKIFHIHLEDIQDRKHYHLIPGQGNMNFQAIFAALQGVGYHGFICVELYTCHQNPTEAARQAREFLLQFPVWNQQ